MRLIKYKTKCVTTIMRSVKYINKYLRTDLQLLRLLILPVANLVYVPLLIIRFLLLLCFSIFFCSTDFCVGESFTSVTQNTSISSVVIIGR